MMRRLEHDETDIRLLMEGALPRCPFCEGNAVTFNSVNDRTQIFRGVVSCTGCMAQVGYNAKSRKDALDGAIARWKKRPAPKAAPSRSPPTRERIATVRPAFYKVGNASLKHVLMRGFGAMDYPHPTASAEDMIETLHDLLGGLGGPVPRQPDPPAGARGDKTKKAKKLKTPDAAAAGRPRTTKEY